MSRVEEAGGVFLTRGGVPLETDFRAAAVSSNAALAGAMGEILGF